jgi:threonine dehydrogenase-like Zn-dependent dehydrogenase
MTGVGFEHLKPATLPRPKVAPDEILLHQRVVTLCYSSIKVLQAGNKHPRLAGRDLVKDPVYLGDECYGVVAEVGEKLRDRFHAGEHIAVSPDIGDDAFGYGVPGGVQQLNVIRGKMLDYLLGVSPEAVHKRGMFAMPLSEPLACVERALSLEYRTAPRSGGRTLVWADEGTDRRSQAPFDDVFVESSHPEVIQGAVDWARPRLNRRGVIAILGDPPAGCKVKVDLGQAHYERTLIVGSDRADIADAYTRNASFGLRSGGTVLLFGAGGPMGQFFLMCCAAEKRAKPAKVIAVEILPERVKHLKKLVSQLDTDVDISVVDVSKEPTRVKPGIRGIDYLVVLCPDTEALERWLPSLNGNAVINAFAGLGGRAIMVEARDLCRRGLRVIGHSGSTLDFQRSTLEKVVLGEVDVAPVVAAVGGFDAVRAGYEAAYRGEFPGKIAIYLDVEHPLTSVEKLTGGAAWSAEEERKFLRKFGA